MWSSAAGGDTRSWSWGHPSAWAPLAMPDGGIVNDFMPQATTTLDAAYQAAPKPGATARDLSRLQVKHRATVRRAVRDAIDARGADLANRET